MTMARLASALILLALCIVGSLGETLTSPSQQAHVDLKRAEAFAKLSPGVREYLKTLDPRDYELDIPTEMESLQRRQIRKDNGVIYNCRKGQVAVTYDDGPWNLHQRLGQKWTKAGQQVTFFLNGLNFGCGYDKPYPSYLRESLAAGHLLAGHTWSHPHMVGLTEEQIDRQVELVETMLLKTVGVVPRYFRFPYGEYNATIVSRLQSKHGLTVVQWSEDIGDAAGVAVETQKATYNSFNAGERHLVLNHETHNTSVGTVANAAIARFKSQGIKSQTVHSCIGGSGSPYKVRAKPSKRDASWTCAGKPGPGEG